MALAQFVKDDAPDIMCRWARPPVASASKQRETNVARIYQTYLRSVALGVPGLLMIVLLVPAPAGVPAVALAVNPAILMLLSAWAGAYAAPRMQFRSAILFGHTGSKLSLIVALGSGLVIGGFLTILDCATEPLWRGALVVPEALCEQRGLENLVLGLVYGGITEELIMRWGLLSILAFGLTFLLPRLWAIVIAVVLTAAAFAFAHLPAVWLSMPEPNTAIVVRVLFLNGAAGLAFGAVFVRDGLEGAMLAHMGFHVATFAWSLAVMS